VATLKSNSRDLKLQAGFPDDYYGKLSQFKRCLPPKVKLIVSHLQQNVLGWLISSHLSSHFLKIILVALKNKYKVAAG
jgi:hypothetical protein